MSKLGHISNWLSVVESADFVHVGRDISCLSEATPLEHTLLKRIVGLELCLYSRKELLQRLDRRVSVCCQQSSPPLPCAVF